MHVLQTITDKELEILTQSTVSKSDYLKLKSLAVVKKIESDVRLMDINLQDYKDLDTLCFHLAAVGTSLQKSAFALTLSIAECSAYKTIGSMYREAAQDKQRIIQVITVIQKQISWIAENFGTTFVGDVQAAAWRFIDTYHYLTFADLIKFAHMACNSEFKGEFQYLSSRNFTVEFLNDWIGKYELLRIDALANAEKEFSGFKKAEQDGAIEAAKTYSHYEQMQRNKAAEMLLISDANNKRRTYFESLEMEGELVGNKGRSLFHALSVYFYLGTTEYSAKRNFVNMVKSFAKKQYAKLQKDAVENHGVTEEKYIASILSEYQREIEGLHKKLTPEKIVSHALTQQSEGLEYMSELCAKMKYSIVVNPDMPITAVSIMKLSAKVCQAIKGNYLRYLRDNLETSDYPLTESEYISQIAMCDVEARTKQPSIIAQAFDVILKDLKEKAQ
jgi:hypothetical protein